MDPARSEVIAHSSDNLTLCGTELKGFRPRNRTQQTSDCYLVPRCGTVAVSSPRGLPAWRSQRLPLMGNRRRVC